MQAAARPLTRRAWWLGLLCAAAVLGIWTSFILIARHSAQRSLGPFDLAFLRFAFAGAVALPLLAWRGRALRQALGPAPAQAWARGAVLAGVAGLGYSLLAYNGFFYAPAAHAAVLLPGSLPLWVALLAAWLLKERITPLRAAGLALIVAGDLLVGGSSLWAALHGAATWRGDLLFLSASCVWGLYTVLCRRWRVGALDATLAIALGCLLSYVPLYALLAASGLVPSRLGAAPWGEIIFQAVYQGGLAMWAAGLAFTQVVQTFGPVRTTMITAVVPVLAALSAVPLLGEPLSAAALGGLLCVSCGLGLGLRAMAAPMPPLQGRPA